MLVKRLSHYGLLKRMLTSTNNPSSDSGLFLADLVPASQERQGQEGRGEGGHPAASVGTVLSGRVKVDAFPPTRLCFLLTVGEVIQ